MAAWTVLLRGASVSGMLVGLILPAAAADIAASTTLNLARFTTWPEEATYGQTFRLCLRDDDPALRAFIETEGETVKGRPVSLHAVPASSLAVRPCHAVYFSPGYADEAVVTALKARPVLTVSSEEGFAGKGGLVELRRRGDEVTIVIDRAVVIDHPLTISAQLLDMAEEVGP